MNNPFKKGVAKIDIETQKQLAFPNGQAGKNIGNKLYRGNVDVIDRCLEHIIFKKNLKICDIGCGPGYAINKIIKWRKIVEIVGVDPSRTMRAQAKKHNKEAFIAGKVKIINASTPKLPLLDNHFDYVLVVNVIYFWCNIKPHLQEIFRILKAGGKLILYFTAKSSLEKRISTKDGIYHLYTRKYILKTLSNLGFTANINNAFTRNSGEKGIIVVAVK